MQSIEDLLWNEQSRKNNTYNQMKCPNLIGSINNVTFSSLNKIIDNMQAYTITYPISGYNPYAISQGLDDRRFYRGPDYALGSNYFIESGDVCDTEKSDPECQGKPRYIYVRNIPTGKIPLLGNISMEGITECNLEGLSESRGILPGILEDLSDINPNEIGLALAKEGNIGSPVCHKKEYPVGSNIYDKSMNNKTWKKIGQCTSSHYHLKTATTGDSSQLFPSPSIPFVGDETEPFTNHKDPSFSWYQFQIVCFIVILLLGILIFFNIQKK